MNPLKFETQEEEELFERRHGQLRSDEDLFKDLLSVGNGGRAVEHQTVN